MRSERSKLLIWTAALAGAAAPMKALAVTDVDPPALEDIEDTTDVTVTDPTNTWYGTRGLPHTGSAEALGQGRLILGINAPWYRQMRTFQGVPNRDADIYAGRASAALGINRFIDGFATLSFYGSNDYNSAKDAGFGTYGGGVQGTFPFPAYAPIRLGAQVAVFDGRSENPIDSNQAAGYDYFETRTGVDVHTKLLQTLAFGSEANGFKFHLNEGIVSSIESGVEPLLVTGAAIQYNTRYVVGAVELNSRTQLDDVQMDTDPLWVTPSLFVRTGYNTNINFGGDISLSREKDNAAVAGDERALEPYRLFGGLALTFDTQEPKRREIRDEARRRSEAEQRLRMENAALAAQVRSQDTLRGFEVRRGADTSGAMEDRLLSTGLLVMDAVHFKVDSATLDINSKPYLDILSKMLTKYPKLQIQVAGHTDSTASEAYNMELSENRAAAVKAYMAGIEPSLADRIVSRGFGESMPKADNGTPEGRLENRRTELEVINKEALDEYRRDTEQARGPETE